MQQIKFKTIAESVVNIKAVRIATIRLANHRLLRFLSLL